MGEERKQKLFNFEWSQHDANIKESSHRFLLSEHLTDMILSCEGYTLKCHRLILAAASYYFERIFSFHNPSAQVVIILKDIKYSEMVSVLEFIYKGSVRLAEHEVQSFLQVGENLELKGLMQNPKDQKEQQQSCQIEGGNGSGTEAPVKAPMADGPSSSSSAKWNENCQNAQIRMVNRGFEVRAKCEGSKSQAAQVTINENAGVQEKNLFTDGLSTRPIKVGRRRKKANKPTNLDSPTPTVDNKEPAQNINKSGTVAVVATDKQLVAKRDGNKEIERKPKSSYKLYTTNAMTDAMEAVRGGMSCFKASTLYKVPNRTLYEKTKKLGMYKTDAKETSPKMLALPEPDQKQIAVPPGQVLKLDVAACVPEEGQVNSKITNEEQVATAIDNIEISGAGGVDHTRLTSSKNKKGGAGREKALLGKLSEILKVDKPVNLKVEVKRERPRINSSVSTVSTVFDCQDRPFDFNCSDPLKQPGGVEDRPGCTGTPETPTESGYESTVPFDVFNNTP